ncbi:neurofilament heavy polypeptide [Diachasma alloeum]|uniref:neurofilament heavy polypeptide n=1 Tax=Diachasma alloeum TaxID=454923 RepID=UPI0007381B4B|nr:neurofilament heavy polypeptide [Diachasma alloeum]
MPKQECLICATDEGLFLDVFAHGKDIRDVIENYLSLEVQKSKLPSTKICYKCAYELTECNKFIGKFNQVHDEKNTKKSSRQKGHCNICSEPGKKGFIYDLQNEALNNVFTQVQDLFGHDFSLTNKTFSVCLYCRYQLDVLSDLKKVAKNNSPSGDAFSKLPKVNVNVIRRKTTSVALPAMSTPVTHTSINRMPTKKNSKVSRSASPSDRQCDKCEMKIENGIDMYRFHTTGQKLCKDCWVSMDPAKQVKGRQRNAPVKSSTKLCTVVLKDVLINPPDGKSRNRRNSLDANKTELDRQGNVIYVISDDSEGDHTPVKSQKVPKRSSSENDTKSIKKTKRDMEFIPQRETRAASVMSTVSTSSNASRPSPKRRHSDNFEVPDPAPKRLRGRAQRAVNKPEAEKIDDKKTNKTPVKAKAPVQAKSKASKKANPPKNASSNEEAPRKPSQREKYHEDAEEGTRRSTRIRKPTKHWSETSESTGLSEEDTEETTSESESSKNSTKNVKTKTQSTDKSPKTPAQKRRGRGAGQDEEAQNTEETEGDEQRVDSDGDNQPYTCTVCSTEFETKVEGMTHQLSHSKKLGVVLEKVSVSESVEDTEKEVEEEKDDQQHLATEVTETERIEDSSKTVDALEVTKDAGPSENDEKPDENDAKNKQDSVVEISGESKGSEKSSEVVKQPVGETEPTEDKKSEKEDETESEKLPEIDTSNKNDGVLRHEEETTTKLSKDNNEKVEEVDAADKEAEKKNADEKEESALNESKVLSEEKNEENDSQKPDNDKTGTESQSLGISEEKNEEPEKEDVQHLTNGKNKDTPSTQPDDSEEKKEDETPPDEETTAKADENVSEERSKEGDEKKVAGTDAAVKETEQGEQPKNVEQNNENDNCTSDEEKSPEAEPLSPPRPDDVLNGDDEQVSKGESEAKIVEETNGEHAEKVEEVKSNPDGEKIKETTGNGGVTEGANDSSENVRKVPEGEINADEASMDAIERQMETIVGKEATGETTVLNTDETKKSARVPLLNPAAAAEEKEVS